MPYKGKTLGAAVAVAFAFAVSPAAAQYIGQTEGAYSGRYTQDYTDYNTGRAMRYRGERAPARVYRRDDNVGVAAPMYRPRGPDCMNNEGRYICSR